jgi:hypothetical protein
VMAELPNVGGFAAAAKHITPAAVAEAISCGPSVEKHVAAVRRYAGAGFDHIVLVQVGQEQAEFIDFFKETLGPALRAG